MQKYLDLIMGLISGIALTFLNNDIVHESITSIFTIFNPVNDSKISLFLLVWASKLIVFLSFIGIIITIAYSLGILKAILIRKQS